MDKDAKVKIWNYNIFSNFKSQDNFLNGVFYILY